MCAWDLNCMLQGNDGGCQRISHPYITLVMSRETQIIWCWKPNSPMYWPQERHQQERGGQHWWSWPWYHKHNVGSTLYPCVLKRLLHMIENPGCTVIHITEKPVQVQQTSSLDFCQICGSQGSSQQACDMGRQGQESWFSSPSPQKADIKVGQGKWFFLPILLHFLLLARGQWNTVL